LVYLNPSETSCYDFAVSIDNINISNEINIYPNPFSIGTTIKFPKEMIKAELYIYDMTGKLVRQINKIFRSDYFVKRESLSDGIYFVRIVECGRNIF
jgi:hypothetical protein